MAHEEDDLGGQSRYIRRRDDKTIHMTRESSNFDARLAELADEARRTEAVQARRQHDDRKLAAALSGTFAGTLTEIAETGAPVTVQMRTGGIVRGQIVSLGPNVVVLRVNESSLTVLSRLAIEGLREVGAGHDRMIDVIDGGANLAEILDNYAQGGRRVAFTLSTGNIMMGRIDRVGIDQVVIRLDGDGESMTIPLTAVDQVTVSA